MNRKIVRIIVPILILMELSFLFLTFMSFSNKDVEETKKITKVDKKKFAMYKQDESGEYVEITDTETFPEDLSLDMEKTYCMDENDAKVSNGLTYENGQLTVTSNKTLFCYLYFKKAFDIKFAITVDNVSSTVPAYMGYIKTASCEDGSTPTWDYVNNRMVVSNIFGEEVECTLNYTKDTTSYTTLISAVQSNATNVSTTVGYRYKGNNPDNYIWFNNEIWRIIGSIPTCTSSGCATSENLVKIIRRSPLGVIKYTTNPANGAWSEDTILYQALNNYYFDGDNDGVQNARDTTYCTKDSVCDFTDKGFSPNDNYGSMVKNVYWNTGSTTIDVGASTAYTNEKATQTVQGYIGLMTASEYGYATSGSVTTALNTLSNDIISNNWLSANAGLEYTMTQYTTTTTAAVTITDFGDLDTTSASISRHVRPALYLDSSVYVVSGDGTEANPYRIAMR